MCLTFLRKTRLLGPLRSFMGGLITPIVRKGISLSAFPARNGGESVKRVLVRPAARSARTRPS